MDSIRYWQNDILQLTGAGKILSSTLIQSLWSGYGVLARVQLGGGPHSSVILKLIHEPKSNAHPRGWDTDRSHQRKLRSYEVERHWYQRYRVSADDNCRMAKLIGSLVRNESLLMILEDLDDAGFSKRFNRLTTETAKPCIEWLAAFHARYMNVHPRGLWPEGSYWHLQTRPDEWQAMTNRPLKMAAEEIDQRLFQCEFRTLVHGDAKVANFCFDHSGSRVAAVDFQYVGGGCGMRDLAYFLGSCLTEDECRSEQSRFLSFYFDRLQEYLDYYGISISFDSLRREWTDLYTYAWTDFYRFLQGWMPGHQKINLYTLDLAAEVLQEIKQD